MKPRHDIYSSITAQLVAAIEAGVGEWRMPWHHSGAPVMRPTSAAGRAYSGINRLVLWASAEAKGFESGTWATYQQWKSVDAQVRKGECGTHVILWKRQDRDDPATPDSEGRAARFFARSFVVFNRSQVDGAANDHVDVELPMSTRIADAKAFIERVGVHVTFGLHDAYYRPDEDRIYMPARSAFDSDEAMISTEGHKRVGVRSASGWGVGGEGFAPVSIITVCERREAKGLDAHVPLILCGDALYDPDLDRFFLDLPLSGVRSRHSLRAYAYDVTVWLRFLDACGKTVWDAARDDVDAYHRERRRDEADHRITAASWNRAVASLDRLYRWGEQQGLISEAPFSCRTVWRPAQGGRRGMIAARNDAYERVAKRSDVRFVTMDDYRIFREVGLRGLTPDGTERPGARDRNGLRNALFADLLVTTGLRLEEASGLLAAELAAIDRDNDQAGQLWLPLPPPLTKGDRGRSVLVPRRLLRQIAAYVAVERAAGVAKFAARDGAASFERPIPVTRAGLDRMRDVCTPEERCRLILCDEDGTPREPAALWLTEVGQPVRPNSWEVIFTRACKRCKENGFPLSISPHQLRHAFAVHMLALLIQQRLREAALPAGPVESYRLILGDPLQQVQRLLGHASLATTYIYLDHIATRADTVDAAVEELLALLPGPQGA